MFENPTLNVGASLSSTLSVDVSLNAIDLYEDCHCKDPSSFADVVIVDQVDIDQHEDEDPENGDLENGVDVGQKSQSGYQGSEDDDH